MKNPWRILILYKMAVIHRESVPFRLKHMLFYIQLAQTTRHKKAITENLPMSRNIQSSEKFQEYVCTNNHNLRRRFLFRTISLRLIIKMTCKCRQTSDKSWTHLSRRFSSQSLLLQLCNQHFILRPALDKKTQYHFRPMSSWYKQREIWVQKQKHDNCSQCFYGMRN